MSRASARRRTTRRRTPIVVVSTSSNSLETRRVGRATQDLDPRARPPALHRRRGSSMTSSAPRSRSASADRGDVLGGHVVDVADELDEIAPPFATARIATSASDDAQRIRAAAKVLRPRAESAAHRARIRPAAARSRALEPAPRPSASRARPSPPARDARRCPSSSLSVAGAGTGRMPCAAFTVPSPSAIVAAVHAFDAEQLESPDARRRRRESRPPRRLRADALRPAACRGSRLRPSRSP